MLSCAKLLTDKQEVRMTTPDKTETALWRYGLISRLLHRDVEEETLDEVLQQLAARSYRRPDGTWTTFSPETIRKWLYRYRHGGLTALGDTPRTDSGTHRAVPEKIADRLEELRREHPRWTLARMFDQLIREELWNMTSPSRATLYRYADTVRLHRDLPVIPADTPASTVNLF